MSGSKALEVDQIAERKRNQAKNGELGNCVIPDSRVALLEQLSSFGFEADQYAACTIEQLKDLVRGARWLRRTYEEAGSARSSDDDKSSGPGLRSRNEKHGIPCFTEVDKKVLKSLLDSNGRVSSLALSRRLEIPLTTIQRRRKRLESEFVESSYSLRLDKLGWRKAQLLVSTQNGMTSSVGNELLMHDSVTSVSKSIGEHTIDLHVTSVFKDNRELLTLIEWIKSLKGVKDVVWTEAVELVGTNRSIEHQIVDKHL